MRVNQSWCTDRLLHVSHLRHDDLARFVHLIFTFVTQHQLMNAGVVIQRLKGQKPARVHGRLKHVEVGGDFGPVEQGLVLRLTDVVGKILAINETGFPFQNIRTQMIVPSFTSPDRSTCSLKGTHAFTCSSDRGPF